MERAEIQRLALEAAQAVVAAGHRAPLERDVIKHLAEGDRHHGEIDAAAAHQQHAKQRADDAAEERAGDDRNRRAQHRPFEDEAGAIGAEPEPGGVTERQHAGEAEQEIERHGGEAEHQHAAAERGVAAEQRHPERRRDERRPDGRERGDVQPGRRPFL